ncbi:sn-glycerol-3-phosphate ABC transporter substrate-binding protein, partial [Brucella oryzae]
MLFRLSTTSALPGALSLTLGSQAFAQTDLASWHGMTGAHNEMVNALSKEVNEGQRAYKFVPVYTGCLVDTSPRP